MFGALTEKVRAAIAAVRARRPVVDERVRRVLLACELHLRIGCVWQWPNVSQALSDPLILAMTCDDQTLALLADVTRASVEAVNATYSTNRANDCLARIEDLLSMVEQ